VWARASGEEKEDPMNADVLTTRVADAIAVVTLGSARRIYFDEEMGDALTEENITSPSRSIVVHSRGRGS
jgi:hypothetical protein